MVESHGSSPVGVRTCACIGSKLQRLMYKMLVEGLGAWF